MKFWFYAIILGITQNVIRLWGVFTAAPTKADFEKITAKADSVKAGNLVKTIVLDVFDLMIPGSVTGWIKVGAVPFGIAALISSVFSLKGMWNRC
jgi:hypothetical protein